MKLDIAARKALQPAARPAANLRRLRRHLLQKEEVNEWRLRRNSILMSLSIKRTNVSAVGSFRGKELPTELRIADGKCWKRRERTSFPGC